MLSVFSKYWTYSFHIKIILKEVKVKCAVLYRRYSKSYSVRPYLLILAVVLTCNCLTVETKHYSLCKSSVSQNSF